MKKLALSLIVLFVLSAASVQAGDPKVITLKDGSRITGRIISLTNNRYTVETASLGNIQIKEDDVVSMTLPGETAAPTQMQPQAAGPQGFGNMNGNPYAGQIQSMQAQIMSDPAIMTDIQALAQDPDMLAAIADPAFLQAVQSGNIDGVQSSPQLQRLMQNPQMQALMNKIRAGQ